MFSMKQSGWFLDHVRSMDMEMQVQSAVTQFGKKRGTPSSLKPETPTKRPRGKYVSDSLDTGPSHTPTPCKTSVLDECKKRPEMVKRIIGLRK